MKTCAILVLPWATYVAGCAVSMQPAAAPGPAPTPAATAIAATAPAEPTAVPAPAAPASEPASIAVAVPTPGPAPADTYEDQDPTALQDFRSELDPHGVWIEDANYGTLWVPNAAEVGADFVPYVSAGHWIYRDDYVWDSAYDWGWAPFHYGRWVPLSAGGWGWIPGREFAPAWVEWQIADGYVGWAPAAPTFIWRGGAPVAPGFAAPEPYVFCANANIFSPAPASAILVGPHALDIEAQGHPYVATGVGRVGAPGVAVSGVDHPAEDPGYAIHGPAPVVLGVAAPPVVVSGDGEGAGLVRARAFARPSSAVVLGAHAPVRVFTHVAVGPGFRRRTYDPYGPRYGRPIYPLPAVQPGPGPYARPIAYPPRPPGQAPRPVTYARPPMPYAHPAPAPRGATPVRKKVP